LQKIVWLHQYDFNKKSEGEKGKMGEKQLAKFDRADREILSRAISGPLAAILKGAGVDATPDEVEEIIQADGTELQLPSIKIDTVSGTITVTTTSTDTTTSIAAGGPVQQGLRSLNVELRMPVGRDGGMVLPAVRM
jgi:hypothetical protein